MIEVIRKRCSTRKYKDQPLDDKTIGTLIASALHAPTAINRQEIQIAVLKKGNPILTELNDELFAGKEEHPVNFYYDAPLVLILSGPKAFHFSQIDGGIAVENVALAAQSMGLGSVIIGCILKCFEGENADHYRELLQFKEGYDFIIAIAVGYQETGKPPHDISFENNVTYFD